MEIETVWGLIRTRKHATRLTRTHYILLKDNPCLKPLFDWLRITNVKTMRDVKPESHKLKLLQAERDFEVKLEVVDDGVFPMLTFRNTVPLQGRFPSGIRECLKTLYGAMYNPDSR